jgi:hypothetical protein
MPWSARRMASVAVSWGRHLGHACTEGDEHFFVVAQEEACGQLALQALHGFHALFLGRVGQQDHNSSPP